MLVILRDRGIPLPAGAILISPWVDLTHSFPSIGGDGSLDYIPAHGFLNKPSLSWPPQRVEPFEEMAKDDLKMSVGKTEPRVSKEKLHGDAINELKSESKENHHLGTPKPVENALEPQYGDAGSHSANVRPGLGHYLSIAVKGETILLKDQIHMYTTNQLIFHPLVSPVLQPSLGGLPPLLILTGGGEVLRDEQIYLAHKAAHPIKYPPGKAFLERHSEALQSIAKWRPTNVQLQVWDDLCHVVPVLSFTRPAKYMYRSIAQFGAWSLARAQKTDIQIQDDDISATSSGSDTDSDQPSPSGAHDVKVAPPGQDSFSGRIGKAGCALPPFKSHMIRQRVDRHGNIYPLGPASSLPGLQVPADEIGTIKPGPVLKWRAAQDKWNIKFAKERRKIESQRAKDMVKGFDKFDDNELPPPSALAGRKRRISPQNVEMKKTKGWGLGLWSLWNSAYDAQMARIVPQKTKK